MAGQFLSRNWCWFSQGLSHAPLCISVRTFLPVISGVTSFLGITSPRVTIILSVVWVLCFSILFPSNRIPRFLLRLPSYLSLILSILLVGGHKPLSSYKPSWRHHPAKQFRRSTVCPSILRLFGNCILQSFSVRYSTSLSSLSILCLRGFNTSGLFSLQESFGSLRPSFVCPFSSPAIGA